MINEREEEAGTRIGFRWEYVTLSIRDGAYGKYSSRYINDQMMKSCCPSAAYWRHYCEKGGRLLGDLIVTPQEPFEWSPSLPKLSSPPVSEKLKGR